MPSILKWPQRCCCYIKSNSEIWRKQCENLHYKEQVSLDSRLFWPCYGWFVDGTTTINTTKQFEIEEWNRKHDWISTNVNKE